MNGYYYRVQRRGGKVIRSYVGRLSDPVTDIIRRFDRSRKSRHALNRAAERNDEDAEHEQLMRAYDLRFRTVIWSFRRATQMANAPTHHPWGGPRQKPTKEEFLVIVSRTEDGDEHAREELEALLDQHPDLWQPLGDLGRLVESHLITRAAGNSVLARTSIERFVEKLRTTLPRNASDPLARLLVDRVVVCHLDALIRQTRANEAMTAAANRRAQRLLDQAQRRQFESIRALHDYLIADAAKSG